MILSKMNDCSFKIILVVNIVIVNEKEKKTGERRIIYFKKYEFT